MDQKFDQNPSDKSVTKNSRTPVLNRRRFLTSILIGGTLAALDAQYLSNESPEAAVDEMSLNSNLDTGTITENGCLVRWEHMVGDSQMEFIPFRAGTAQPYEENGNYFDLISSQSLSHEEYEGSPESRLLLAKGDIYESPMNLEWRNSSIEPLELLKSAPFKKVISVVETNMAMWEKEAEDSEKSGSEADPTITPEEAYLKGYKEMERRTIDMNSPILKIHQVQHGVAKALQYKDDVNELSRQYENTALHLRLQWGLTNCQEYALVTSIALARMGIASEIILFAYKHEGQTKYHVANVVTIDDTCVVVDSNSGQMQSLTDYFRTYRTNGKQLLPTVRYTSFIAYPPSSQRKNTFPWHDSQWVRNNKVALGMRGFYKSIQ